MSPKMKQFDGVVHHEQFYHIKLKTLARLVSPEVGDEQDKTNMEKTQCQTQT